MVLNKNTTRLFHRTLYCTELVAVTLLKRGDNQAQGRITNYTLYGCMLPGTTVEGRISGASKSFYSGEAVKLRTVSKSIDLNCTINHPVLTPHGFIAAGLIKPGTYLLCHRGVEGSSTNIQNRPTKIEDVFESFAKVGNGFAARTPSSFDFHGDGESIQGKINIVRPNWVLMKHGVPQIVQKISDFDFLGFDLGLLLKNSLGKSYTLLKRVFSPFCHHVGFSDLIRSLFWGHSIPLELFSFASTSQTDSPFLKNPPNNITFNEEFSGQGSNRFSGSVTTNYFPEWNMGVESLELDYASFGSGSKFNTVRPEPVADSSGGDTEFLRQLLGGFPGEVFADKVASIDHFHYDGPVYDLETPVGYYTASTVGSKVFVSNCRRGQIVKTGQTLQGDMTSDHRAPWHIPRSELDRVGVQWLNPLDRIIDPDGNTWQPEGSTTMTEKLFKNYYVVDCYLRNPPRIVV